MRTLRVAQGYISLQAREGQEVGQAAEWLLDNFHLIEEQLREIRAGLPLRFYRSLPVLQEPPLVGLPRVYGVAWAFVAHTDSAFSEVLLRHFLNAYQSDCELNQSELWALPTTLRVVLLENVRRLAERIAKAKAAQELATVCVSRISDLTLPTLQALHQNMHQYGVENVFLAHLLQNLKARGHHESMLAATGVHQWLQQAMPDLGTWQAQHHIDRAADHLSMRNAFTALRSISAASWSDIVAVTSSVMRVMMTSAVFAAEDDSSRNKTLHAIERLAAASQHSESDVARLLLGLMAKGVGPTSLAAHWLEGDGLAELEQKLGIRHLLPKRWLSYIRLSRIHAYFGSLVATTLLVVLALSTTLVFSPADDTSAGLLRAAITMATVLLILLPASEGVLTLINRLISEATRPTYLGRLRLTDGLPASAQTLVVVPALLSHTHGIDCLVRRLLLHHLANPETNAQFALLSDWGDARSAQVDGDEALLAHARQALQGLNTQYPVKVGQPPRFLLLHRARTFSHTQGLWMGWERKRGKLEQLLATLATGESGPFFDLDELSRMAPSTRYVITLDSDTELPPGQLRALVGVAEHPQNQPVLDPGGHRVIRGYGILQPRVVAPLPMDSETPWQWLFAGQRGMDPYSAMSSDVYQDVFGEGSFTGKGLLHVATLHAVLGGRLPSEQVLSHDLLEGALARCAVVSDITLIESDPLHADAAAARLHRWIRGDWQLWPFLWAPRRWPLGALNRWKMFDNLRRSLVAPASLALVLMAMAGQGLPLGAALLLTGTAFAGGPVVGGVANGFPAHGQMASYRFFHAALMDLLRALAGGAWHIAMLLQHAATASDAVFRTAYRLRLSRKQLLSWTTADAAQARLRPGLTAALERHWREPVAVTGLLWLLWMSATPPTPAALALLLTWAGAPGLIWLFNTRWTAALHTALPPADKALLQGVARDSWRLFERCVNANHHHLPPDNLQCSPLEVVAHRTSPTNIGLYLLSAACARQLGWIGTQALLSRLEDTVQTLTQLERHRGHFLNWYDTQSLRPLLPRYVSTVDSGNLMAHLLAVAQACRELSVQPHQGCTLEEALRLSQQRLEPYRERFSTLLSDPAEQAVLLALLTLPPPGAGEGVQLQTWQEMTAASHQALAARVPTSEQLPLAIPTATSNDPLWWLLGDHLATLDSMMLDRMASGPVGDLLASQRLIAVAKALEELAWAPDFQCLYHHKRHLLHIGYRVEDQALDTAFYDLLASESHLTSLMAIAKGDLPVRHWNALGRPFYASGRHAVLRSWSGSMFEYLMPALLIAPPRGSVLKEANQSALREQMAFGRAEGLPWGMSESAYAGRDESLAYQYAPQGVQRLALRRNPPEERVVAPYATALAAQVNVRQACRNWHRLEHCVARGRYGFMEALDFTPGRQVNGSGFTRVNTYMAHHQGMTIVALSNVLCEGVAQRWGMAHPRLEAISALLHERPPRELAASAGFTGAALTGLSRRAQTPVRVLASDSIGVAPTLVLSNGQYSLTLRPNGAGWSRLGQVGIGRWRDDALRDTHGSFIYLRRSPQGVLASVTSHPAPDPQATYQTSFGVDRVCFEASWPDLRVYTTVWVSPEDDVELRKVQLTNVGECSMELELMAALDVTLAVQADDEVHPAFSSLFVQAEWLKPQRALRYGRTPRLPSERAVWMAHFLVHMQGDIQGLRIQTDRQQWLGRHRPHSHPLGRTMAPPAESGPLITGLDPVAALGAVLHLAPGARACFTFATAASHDQFALSAMMDKYLQPSAVERSSTMSAALATIQTQPIRLHPEYLPAQQALTTALLMVLPKVTLSRPGECAHHGMSAGHSDRRLLWPLGLSGERPLLLVHASSSQGLALLRVMAQLLREWSRAGIACELVVLSQEPYAHHMPLQQSFMQMCNLHQADTPQPGDPCTTGFHILHTDNVSPGQIDTLRRLARVELHADGRSFLHQIREWMDCHRTLAKELGADCAGDELPVRPQAAHSERSTHHRGQFNDRTGAFSFAVGPEDPSPPRPWINVLANADFGALVTDSGAGYTWARNSHLNQLTPWSNDPVGDPPSEWFLVQDLESRDMWSLAPSAWGDHRNSSQVEHSQGVTTISQQHGFLKIAMSWCVDPDTSVKQVRVRLANQGHRQTELRLLGMVEWMLGRQRGDRATLHTAPFVDATLPDKLVGLLCSRTEASSDFEHGTAFFCLGQGEGLTGADDQAELDWTCNRQAFFNRQGRLSWPHNLGQQSGSGLDPCAAITRQLSIPPGVCVEQVFLIGYAETPESAEVLARKAAHRNAAERETAVGARWDSLLGATQVLTPDRLLNVLVNRWLLYQTVSSRLWAKAAFYQAGGATGYRDQLQDAMALAWAAPAMLREQIVLCASRQFEPGDVQHWWHDPGGAGVRTHSSDDLLWLPFACAHYLRVTGDDTVLDEQRPFLQGTVIATGAEDAYDTPRPSGLQASVYEHAARSIDHSLRVGQHGLPLMGGGDWNDGMNRVGHQGQGESVWLAWFLCDIVRQWAPLAHLRGEPGRAQRWETARQGWQKALQGTAWDGQWYLRAFFDDGSPLGGHAQDEAQIDLIPQAWAVLSDEAPLARQRQAMEAVHRQLADPLHGLLHLLTPPLSHSRPSPGYLQVYPPGIRENGAQYTHAGVWAMMACAALARLDPGDLAANARPYQYFTWLSPAHRAQHPSWGLTYGLEPYAVAADVYTYPPYEGRGGWSWYTGAAGWMHRAALESIMGLHLEAQALFFMPSLPSEWPKAEMTLVRAGQRLHFVLFRGSTALALAACGHPHAQVLPVGQRLCWPQVPTDSCFVIPLPGPADPVA